MGINFNRNLKRNINPLIKFLINLIVSWLNIPADIFKELMLLKACNCIKFLSFHQMIALQKLWKMLFISSKSSFCSQDIQIFVFPSFPLFLSVGHCFRGWLKINPKIYDTINCPHKNSTTDFVWYLTKEKSMTLKLKSIDGVSNKEHFLWKKLCGKCAAKARPRPFYDFGK